MEETKTLELISNARDILEEIGECCPAYVSFERDEYTLSKDQIQLIATALYFADCEISDLLKNKFK